MSLSATQKWIVIAAAVAIFASGLFPPWLATFDVTASHDSTGRHSENDAGYHLVLTPPPRRDGASQFGIKLDTSRLFLEWVCILSAGVTAWMIAAQPKKDQIAQAN